EDRLPRPAIRPYPMQYVAPWTLKDGSEVTVRPIRPEDEPLMVKFHEALSEQSVYWRYFHPMKFSQRVAHERLQRICFIDYDREMALVAERKGPQTADREIIAVGRLSKSHDRNEAEFALLVSDRFQRQGLGTELLSRLVAIGRQERLGRIIGSIIPDKRGMQRTCEKLGFRLRNLVEERLVRAEIELSI